MKTAVRKEFCDAAVVKERRLVLGEVPMPVAGKGEVLIKVAAIGVNRVEIDQKKGDYKAPLGASPVLGLEVAGTVVGTGERVMALLTGGGYAAYAAAPLETVLPIPERLSFEQAAAVPEAYFTIWSNLFMDRPLAAGQVLLVHGGASGVGSAMIQLAKAFGATVIATAGTLERALFCKDLGADLAIDYSKQDFEAEIRKFIGERGVDVIFDWVGARYLNKHLALLARHGRLVLIDSRTKDGPALDLGPVMRKNLVITGALLRPRPLSEKKLIAGGVRRDFLPLLVSGKLTPIVSHRFPLAEAEKAHAVVEESLHHGKVVLIP
jgi:NADPH2:quinone reductase